MKVEASNIFTVNDNNEDLFVDALITIQVNETFSNEHESLRLSFMPFGTTSDIDFMSCRDFDNSNSFYSIAGSCDHEIRSEYNKKQERFEVYFPSNETRTVELRFNFTLENYIEKIGDYYIFESPHPDFASRNILILSENGVPYNKLPKNSRFGTGMSIVYDTQELSRESIWFWDEVERNNEIENRQDKYLWKGVFIGGFVGLVGSLITAFLFFIVDHYYKNRLIAKLDKLFKRKSEEEK